jgi:outer membrane lipoprotein-sorting protein
MSRRSAGARNEELAFFSAPYSLTSAQIKSRYNISHVGDEQVDGSSASVLELVPKGPSSIVKLKWWVSHSSWLPVKSQAFERGAVTTFSLSDTKINAQIDRSQFNFKCPSGSEIVRR